MKQQREKIYNKSLLVKHCEYLECNHQAHFFFTHICCFFQLVCNQVTCISYKMTQDSFRGCSFMCKNQTWLHLFQQCIPQCQPLSVELHQQYIYHRQSIKINLSYTHCNLGSVHELQAKVIRFYKVQMIHNLVKQLLSLCIFL